MRSLDGGSRGNDTGAISGEEKKQKGLVLRICVILGMEEDPRNGNEFEEK